MCTRVPPSTALLVTLSAHTYPKVWLRSILVDQPPIVIHENVPGFDVEMLTKIVSVMYWVAVLFVEPAEHGFDMVARRRCSASVASHSKYF